MGGDNYLVCHQQPSILTLYYKSEINPSVGMIDEQGVESVPLDFVNFTSLKQFIDKFYEQAGKINLSDIGNV